MKDLENWLKQQEQYFGGFHNKVPRNVISDLFPNDAYLEPSGMTGGDRMTVHRYAKHYATHLARFVKDRFKPYVVVECGILRGTGLAVWSTLFPNAQIIGLDIDLTHTENNMEFLKSEGAFQTGTLELYEFDQFFDNTDLIKQILNNRTIDIAIDDGAHLDYTILNTYDTLEPYLSKEFCYFVEDHRTIYNTLKDKIKKHSVHRHKQLTVINSQHAQTQ
jgi:acid stress-induced BolA-like protein IbaG/YrbA